MSELHTECPYCGHPMEYEEDVLVCFYCGCVDGDEIEE